MTKLRISDDLALPLDAVTNTFGILAVRGAGKSNTAAVMAEEMFARSLPFVVIDPVGSWYGLRSAGEGATQGLAIPIFGGRHGDVPLERTGGTMLADLVVDERLTCVLDVSELSEGDKVRFLIDFAERLYRRNTEPLHLFLEEADDYCPERFTGDKARLLGAWQNIVRRGRARGLGITMITQRSAALSKSVLTQIETLIVLRTTSPQDRAAIKAWVDCQGGGADMLATLPQLESGEAWVWSPSWLKLFKRVRIRRRRTFDSGATPAASKGKRAPATLADVDLGALRTRMADTIERAKADDPKALRARVAELERELRAKPVAAATKAEPVRVEVPVLSAKDRAVIERAINVLEAQVEQLDRQGAGMVVTLESMRLRTTEAGALATDLRAALSPPAPQPVARPVVTPARTVTSGPVPPRPRVEAGPGEKLGGAERKVLTALAQYPDGRSKTQVAILTGYAHNGGGFNNAISALRSAGRIEGGGDRLRITDAGLTALGSYTPLPTGDALRAHWMGQLGKAERSALEMLCMAYPKALPKDQVANGAGYEPNGGGFNNALSRLRSLELIEGRGELRASAELFG